MVLKILFLVPYPLKEAPSQRFRFEQYFSFLIENGVSLETQSFLNKQDWKIFFFSGNSFGKALALLKGLTKRFFILFKVNKFDFIFIHREAAPIGPPVFEWLIAKMFRKKIIYDFDDAIWLTDRKNEGWALRILKSRGKVARICKWSHKVSCGNEFLCDFARSYNSAVFRVPTTIDTVALHDPHLYKKEPKTEIILGWTGSHSTMKYLKDLEQILRNLELKYHNLTVWVISDQDPGLNIPRLEFKRWTLTSEIENLNQFDIGIMPLPDDFWAKGKCGFKALQYLALGIPAVVSPVGVNSIIVENGTEGFHATSESEWLTNLSYLIEHPEARKHLGENGRKKVEENYSVRSNSSLFLSLFEKS